MFFTAISLVAQIAEEAGVFDVAAHWAARAARHRVFSLWLLLVALAVACTIVLSLDTTAVLLTPVGLAVAHQLRISPRPFALTTLWLANTASLLLPVSNLTNLLALHDLRLLRVNHVSYVRLMLAPAAAAVFGTVLVLYLLHYRELRGRFQLDAEPDSHDPVMRRIAGSACVGMAPLFALGPSPALVSTLAAAVLAGVARRRDVGMLRRLTVPWQMTAVVFGLYIVVDIALRHGLAAGLHAMAGSGSSAEALARVAVVGALAANAANNLPAYLVLQPVTADSAHRLLALLVGVDVGPLVTPWASLATLLWVQRCRAAGVRIGVLELACQGAACALVAGGLAVCALGVLA